MPLLQLVALAFPSIASTSKALGHCDSTKSAVSDSRLASDVNGTVDDSDDCAVDIVLGHHLRVTADNE